MVDTAIPARLRPSALPWAWVGLGVCGAGLVLGAVGASVAGLVLSLLVLCCALPVDVSIPGRLALAVPVWASVNVVVLPALQVLGVRPGAVVVAAGDAVLAVLIRQLLSRDDGPSLGVGTGAWRADVACVLAGIAAVGALLTTWVGHGVDHVMTFFMGAPDSATHLYLVRLVADQRGVLYWANTHTTGGASGLYPYPQGFHLSTAVAGRAVFGALTTATRLFQSFALGSFTSAALFVALGALCASVAARRVGAGVVAQAVAGLAAGAALALGPLGQMLALGFQAQIAGLALLFALLLVSLSPSPSSRAATAVRLVLLGLLIAGLSNTYFSILPVAAPLVAVELVRLRRTWPDWRIVVPAGLILGAATLLPIASGLEGGSFSHLGDTGLAPVLSRPALVGMGLLAVGGLVVPAVRHATRTGVLTFVLTALAALGLQLGVLAYQDMTLGATRYYYEKSVYTTFVLVVVAAAAVGALLLERAVRSLPVPGWVASALLVGVGSVVVAGATGVLTAPDSRPLVSWIEGRSRLPTSPGVLTAAFTPRPAPRDGTTLFVWDPGDHAPAATRFFETRWVNASVGRLDLTAHDFELTWLTSGQHDPALARFVAHTHRRILLIVPRPSVCTSARASVLPRLRGLVTCRAQP